MLFVAGQITIWIIAATIFGFAVGYAARGRRSGRRVGRRRF
jgi:uncharacterized membrane protein